MSLITHGLVGHYTNETYPLPECGFFDWTVSGNSLEFGDFQSRVCISNKVIIGFTVSNVLTVGLTWAFGIYLTIHEFRLVREWNDTKNFLIFFYVGLIGAALFSVNDILGNPVWNSLGWYFATIGICAMEAFTVMVWARITLKISNVKRNIGADAAQTQLLRPLGQLMSGLTIFVCVGLLPVFALRAAWYKFEDPWWYNILMWAYHIIMLPWFPMFAYTVVTFATKLTNLLYETMGAFDELPGTTSGNGVLGTASYGQGSNSAADTTFGKLKAQSRKAKLMSVIKKIRFVAILVCLDKLGFLVSYTTFAIYGGLTMYEPKRGMAAYFSFSAMNGLIVFWGCGLLAGCAYYHLRVDNSPKNKSDRNSSSGSTDVQPQFDMGLNSFQPMNVFSQTPVSGLTAFSQDPRALKQLEAFTPPRPTQAEMAAGNYDLYGGPQKNSVYRRPSQSEAQPNYFGGLTTPSSINSGTTAVQGQQYGTSNDQMQQLQMQNGAWIQQHLALQQQQMLQQQQFTQQQQFSQQQHKPQGGYPYQY